MMMRNGFYAIGGAGRHMFFGRGLFCLLGLAVVSLLIFGTVILVRHMQKNHAKAASVSSFSEQAQSNAANTAERTDVLSAMTILNERYARGDISEEEYAKIKTGLRK